MKKIEKQYEEIQDDDLEDDVEAEGEQVIDI